MSGWREKSSDISASVSGTYILPFTRNMPPSSGAFCHSSQNSRQIALIPRY